MGGVEKVFGESSKVLSLMLLSQLPHELEGLIKSFLPRPPVPYIQIPLYYAYNYMSIEDWNDTEDVRGYGDF